MLASAIVSPAAGGYIWETVAGNPFGNGVSDGPIASSRFDSPVGLAADDEGNVYVTDMRGHTLRKISAAGVVSTLAGDPAVPGADDGIGRAARFDRPYAVAVLPGGSLAVSDSGNHTIRMVSPDGNVSTLAGIAGSQGASDGQGSVARFNSPQDIAALPDGSLLVADMTNHAIRRIAPSGMVETWAGSLGQMGNAEGARGDARFRLPTGLAVAPDGSVFVSEALNHRIRRISPDGMVSTFAGAAGQPGAADGPASVALFTTPMGISLAADGALIVSEFTNQRIRHISPEGLVSTLSGEPGQQGLADGSPDKARYNRPRGVLALPGGDILVADTGNHALRRIEADGRVAMINAGGEPRTGWIDGAGTDVRFHDPHSLVRMADGTWMIADTMNGVIRRLTHDGNVDTFAGKQGVSDMVDGPLAEATFGHIRSLTLDPSGNLVTADYAGPSLRRITPDEGVTTFFTGTRDYDDPTHLQRMDSLTGTPNGDYYFGDNSMLRRVRANGTIEQVAGSPRLVSYANGNRIIFWRMKFPPEGTNGDGYGEDVVTRWVRGLATTPDGGVVLVDEGTHNLRRIEADDRITTIAGLALQDGLVDGTGSNARFNEPVSVAAAADGAFYVLDAGNQMVRRVSPDGVVTTIAGIPGYEGIGDGDTLLLRNPGQIRADPDGTLWIADTGNQRIVRGTPVGRPQLVVDADGEARATGDPAWPFGMMAPGSGNTRSVILRNVGNQPLDVSEIRLRTVSGQGFSLDPPVGLPGTISAGRSVEVAIHFHPVEIGHVDAELIIASDDPQEPLHVMALRGTGNLPPTFAGYSFSVASNAGGTPVPLEKILRHASHPLGHEVHVLRVNPRSRRNQFVRLEDDHLIYTPNRLHAGGDSFIIILADELGYEIEAEIEVNLYGVNTANGIESSNPPKITLLPESRVRLEFHGIPGRAYHIQASSSLTYWETLGSVTADGHGRIEWIEDVLPGSQRFYRVGQN